MYRSVRACTILGMSKDQNKQKEWIEYVQGRVNTVPNEAEK